MDISGPQWITLIVQTGAMGLLTMLIWLLPKVLKDTLKELNENNQKSQTFLYESGKLEREGFAQRSRMLVDELSLLRSQFPQLANKIDQLINEVKDQTGILRDWPSDPDKVCQAHKIMDRCEVLIALLEKHHRPKGL